jgi:hypothetical protein
MLQGVQEDDVGDRGNFGRAIFRQHSTQNINAEAVRETCQRYLQVRIGNFLAKYQRMGVVRTLHESYDEIDIRWLRFVDGAKSWERICLLHVTYGEDISLSGKHFKFLIFPYIDDAFRAVILILNPCLSRFSVLL